MSGEMADALIDDMMDPMYEDDMDPEPEDILPAKPKTFTCKYCGQKDLTWWQIAGKWRLYDKHDVHVCNHYKEKK